MFRRHVDFFAVFSITLGLTVLSQVSALRIPVAPIRIENINANVPVCQRSSQILSRIAYLLNH
jgi:hypothetical protein